MPITAFYAGLLALLFFVLSVRVIGMRRARLISLGDGGDKEMLRRVRAHANCAEYVPIVVLLMALAEGLRTSIYVLHAMGIALLLGRLLHAFALSRPRPLMPARVGGMALTFTALILGAVVCVVQGAQAIFL